MNGKEKRRFHDTVLPAILLPLVFFLAAGFTFKPVPDAEKIVWPLPPDPPKIAYVAGFSEKKDMGVKKGFFQRFKELIVGKEEDPKLLRPTGVFSDGQGTVYVTDTGLQVVHVFDFADRKYRQVFKLSPPPGGKLSAASGNLNSNAMRLLSPIGVVADPWNNLYVSDSLLKRVYVFDKKGRLFQTLGGEGEFERPTGLAIRRELGLLYVVDTLANRVIVYRIEPVKDAKKNAPSVTISKAYAFGKRGGGEGEFNFPTHAALDREGHLYITDSLNFRVQRFDAEGKYIGRFGGAGNILGTFSKPKGIALDGRDHVYVVDNLYDTVQIFDREGTLLLHFGGHGGGPGGFWLPVGIHIDADQYIFVADTYNQRVQIFRFIGE